MMAARAFLNCFLLATAPFWLCHRVVALEAQDLLYFRVGPLALKPQMGVSETFNDNVLYSPRNTLEDFITTVRPGLKLQLGRVEHNYIAVGYTFEDLWYAKNNFLNTSQHMLDIKDRLETERLELVGSDRIQFLSSPLGGVERVISVRNVDREQYDDNYTLNYKVSDRTGVYLAASHTATDYEQGVNLYDIESLVGTLGFGYRALSKTVFFGEVYYGETTTDPNSVFLIENPRLNFIGGYLGARGNFTAKLSGSIKVGYEAREFSDGSSVPSEPVVDIALTERFTDRTSLAFTYSRRNNVSIQYSRQSFTADLIGLQFNQALGPRHKWLASLGGSYSRYDYQVTGAPSSAVEYQYLNFSASLGYQIQRWLSASLGYAYESVSSDTPGAIDYTANRVTLSLSIGY